MKLRIAVLPGDGIGPEVCAEAIRVLKALKLNLELDHGMVGGCAIDAAGKALPPETLKKAKAADAVLFGAVGGPKWSDPTAKVRPEQGILGLRKGLGLFANLRPIKVYDALIDASTLKPEVVRGVDVLILRELTGGCYFGKPQGNYGRKPNRHAVDTTAYTEDGGAPADAHGVRAGAQPPQQGGPGRQGQRHGYRPAVAHRRARGAGRVS